MNYDRRVCSNVLFTCMYIFKYMYVLPLTLILTSRTVNSIFFRQVLLMISIHLLLYKYSVPNIYCTYDKKTYPGDVDSHDVILCFQLLEKRRQMCADEAKGKWFMCFLSSCRPTEPQCRADTKELSEKYSIQYICLCHSCY